MFRQDQLIWFAVFPLIWVIFFWLSIDLALLRRAVKGQYRRENAWRTIERLVLLAPIISSDRIHTEKHGTSEPPGTSMDVPPQQRELSSPVLKVPTKVKSVDISTSLRVATRAVVRRGIVVVGGELARSPRMQYHAVSLAQSGRFDEIVLIGLDCGNQLSEALRMCEQASPTLFPASDDPDEIYWAVRQQLQHYSISGTADDAGDAKAMVQEGLKSDGNAWKGQQNQQGGVFRPRKWGCFVSSRHLITPPTPPEIFQVIFPLRSLHWVACTLYRVVVFTFRYLSSLVRATAIQVNAHGQLVVTEMIIVQTPPAIPFVPLIKYVAWPMVALYNFFLYYGFIVPASWANPVALKAICAVGKGRAGRGFRPVLLVDWHNYGYSILEAARRPRAASELYKWLELRVCAGDVNVTVSQAMRRSLLRQVFHTAVAESASGKEAQDSSTRAVRSRQLNPRGEGGFGKEEAHRPFLSADEERVLVLYDVAPSFFAPSSRRTFVEEVLSATANPRLPLLAQQARLASARTSPWVQDVPPFSREHSRQACDRERVLPQREEPNSVAGGADKNDWGIAPPPAWVINSAFLPSCGDDDPLHRNASEDVIGYPSHSSVAASLMHHSKESCMNMHQQRGIIIVGSTSWTEDDDYTVLIEALQRLDHRLRHVCKYIETAKEHRKDPGDTPSRRNTPVAAHMEGATLAFPSGVSYESSAQAEGQELGTARSSGLTPELEDVACLPHPLSQIWVLITGKGPTRSRFESAVRAAHLSKHITVSTLYFQSYQHYSVALGAADVGLCLHFSSSGLDLPMKGVDMVGCGLPVMAFAYPAIGELMGQVVVPADASSVEQRILTPNTRDNRSVDNAKRGGDGDGLVECERGWIFSSASDLEALLSFFIGMDKLHDGMPSELKTAISSVMSNQTLATKTAKLTSLVEMQRRARAAASQRPTWEDNWNQTLGPIIERFVS